MVNAAKNERIFEQKLWDQKKKRETMTNVCLNKKVDVFVMPRTVCLTDGLTNLNWTQKLKRRKSGVQYEKCLI